MRHAWIALLIVGCESMPSSGDIFTPVKVGTATAPIVEDDGEPWFDDAPSVVISSEEMDAVAEAEATGEPVPEPAAAGSEADDASSPAPGLSAPTASPAATVEAVAAPSTAPSRPMAMVGAAWPVRLVRTLPDTLPPRAILGLPDGSEIVVTPGSMVPEQGLVVVAIGRQTAQLARVSAQGDHAAIQPLLLNAQY
ncbi:MAG: hypothetical protein VX265_14890 [Myxococcota bacterium]|nr:hypothetical protein [Myxococcota bacterium]MEC8422856.1 hypothetical protein [Myxococcota bacterium]